MATIPCAGCGKLLDDQLGEVWDASHGFSSQNSGGEFHVGHCSDCDPRVVKAKILRLHADAIENQQCRETVSEAWMLVQGVKA